MGNYKFRLSDMMPNAWFYKLKDMSSSSTSSRRRNTKSNTSMKKKQPISSPQPQKPKQNNHQFLAQSRKSYYFTRDPKPTWDKFFNNLSSEEEKKSSSDFHDPPRKSSKQNKSRKSTSKAVHVGFAESRSDESLTVAMSDKSSSNADDIIMNTKEKFNLTPEIGLPPIITRKQSKAKTEEPVQRDDCVLTEESKQRSHSFRRYAGNSPGLKLRTKSPRIANMTTQGRRSFSTPSGSCSSSRRRSISQSYAVAKSSFDPQSDFKESMMEMIVENNITASKDLEELLACYLALNSNEYHDLIISVFKQIWVDLSDIKQSK